MFQCLIPLLFPTLFLFGPFRPTEKLKVSENPTPGSCERSGDPWCTVLSEPLPTPQFYHLSIVFLLRPSLLTATAVAEEVQGEDMPHGGEKVVFSRPEPLSGGAQKVANLLGAFPIHPNYLKERQRGSVMPDTELEGRGVAAWVFILAHV